MLDFYKNGRFSHSESRDVSFSDWVDKVGFNPGQKILVAKFAQEDYSENEYKTFWIGHGTKNLSPRCSEDYHDENRDSWKDFVAKSFLDWFILEIWDYEE
jgi:hypothetical protein